MSEMSCENDRFVEGLVASGRFDSRDAVLDHAVELLREQAQENSDEMSGELTAQEWCDRFEQWADSHQTLVGEADDSRESIYAGRGE